ncbi:NACHT domain-containing protein [Streptomyces sp. NPDC008092]|uniref:NACHT domain-containing protein n=1 Tax=Streptomyces sp. NPDC008092 TaxID=3364808 RepID=UPI0036E56EFF
MGTRGWRTVLFLAGAVGLSLVVLLLGGALLNGGLGAASDLSGVLSALLAVVPLATVLLVWRRRMSGRPGPESPIETVDAAKRQLAEEVGLRWRREATIRDQDGGRPMPVVWRERASGGVVLAGATSYPEAQRQMDQLADRFLALLPRRLVVVGEPGAGKTTFAMQLTLALLRPWTHESVRRVPPLVPVPVSASSWSQRYLTDFTAWMADEIARSYPSVARFGTDIPRRLVEGLQVVPVLDGLDELPAVARARVLRTLGTTTGTDQPLILTCRTGEFEQAVRRGSELLATATVVVPEPLTVEAAAAHLRAHLPVPPASGWAEFLRRLEAPGPLRGPVAVVASAVTNPLDLGLLRTTYAVGSTSPGGLLNPELIDSPAALRGHLLDRLIPSLLEQNPPLDTDPGRLHPRRTYQAGEVRRWLTFLATLLARTPVERPYILARAPGADFRLGMRAELGTRDLKWWSLSQLALPRPVLPLTQLVSWVALTAAVGAGVATVAPSKDAPDAAAGVRLVFLGLVIGTISALFANGARRSQPQGGSAEPNSRGLAHFTRRVFGGALGGAMLGGTAAAVLQIDWMRRPMFGKQRATVLDTLAEHPFPVVGIAAAVGAAVGFYTWAQAAWAVNRTGTPIGSLRADRDSRLLRGAAVMVCTAAVLVWLSWSHLHDDGTAQSLIALPAIAVGLTLFSGERAWLVYSVTVGYAACRGDLPWRLMTFLDDAHRLGLLRAVGPVYQFRHAEFQDHLAPPLPPLPPPEP